MADKTKDNYFFLSEALLFFFEKNSFIYLKEALNDKKSPQLLDMEPLNIFKNCILFLHDFNCNKESVDSKLKHIGKLFCLG